MGFRKHAEFRSSMHLPNYNLDAKDLLALQLAGPQRLLDSGNSSNSLLAARRHLAEEQAQLQLQQAIEFQSKRLAELQLMGSASSTSKPLSATSKPFVQADLHHSDEEATTSEGDKISLKTTKRTATLNSDQSFSSLTLSRAFISNSRHQQFCICRTVRIPSPGLGQRNRPRRATATATATATTSKLHQQQQ
eukprot:TRINITY_DN983_c0_g1_i3.p2 TRINITY_DN983_c0_g1~~TRINITY_DN983_c0_g1_i3.p2  ORF type:complete len:192 (-),score=35.77 TRINITY_DN983_c0_g1_i3:785-1360(-)